MNPSDLDILYASSHLCFGFGKRLAVFLRDDASDVVEVIFEKDFELEERLDAVFRRSAAPFRKGGGGSFDGLVDFGGVGEWDLR